MWWISVKVLGKTKKYTKIELIKPNVEIRCKPIREYSDEDIKDFKEQISELKSKGLVRDSYSRHSSPANDIANMKKMGLLVSKE